MAMIMVTFCLERKKETRMQGGREEKCFKDNELRKKNGHSKRPSYISYNQNNNNTKKN